MKMNVRLGALAAVFAITTVLVSPGSVRTARAAALNVVVSWNDIMLTTFARANVPPPSGNRLGAIVQAAVFDAVNGIERAYVPIHVQPAAPDDASPRAAAASAAHSALAALFPSQQAALDAAFASSLAAIADDDDARSIADGISWGASVAHDIVAWRAADGFSSTPPPYVFGSAVGDWQPTPGGSGAPKFRTLATTIPFALTSPSQFRPGGPPPLSSARYAQDFDEVKALGGKVSALRREEQTETARFWQLDTPTAMWDRVADSLALAHHLNLLKTARLLALTDIALADATIAVFDAKNAYNSWRPVTAIVDADLDGNPLTSPDPAWLPLMTTPYFQEYPSAHSGVSSAAATVLASSFGDATTFTVTSDGLPGVQRSYASFSDAVADVADARVFAGFHFRFSCDDAVVLGNRVGTYVEQHLMLRASE